MNEVYAGYFNKCILTEEINESIKNHDIESLLCYLIDTDQIECYLIDDLTDDEVTEFENELSDQYVYIDNTCNQKKGCYYVNTVNLTIIDENRANF